MLLKPPTFTWDSSTYLYLKTRLSRSSLLHLHPWTITTSSTATKIHFVLYSRRFRATCSKHHCPITTRQLRADTSNTTKHLDAIIDSSLFDFHHPSCLLCRFLGLTSSTTPPGSPTTTSLRSRSSVWNSLRRVRSSKSAPPAKPDRFCLTNTLRRSGVEADLRWLCYLVSLVYRWHDRCSKRPPY